MAIMQSCTIDGNALTTPDHTNAWGAAVYSRGDLRLTFSTVTGNSNASGTSEAVHLDNCSSENSAISASSIAANNTGGVHAYGCDLTLRNATIVNNAGPGLRFAQYEPTSGFTLTGGNNIFADNSLSDCTYYNATPSFLHSLDSDNSCGLSVGDGDLPATDPVLLPLRDWGGDTRSMYPKPGESPVIDAGAGGSPCTPFDQRLVQRPVDGDGDLIALCDMGSVEAGDLILWSGFEDGTTDEWSSAATF